MGASVSPATALALPLHRRMVVQQSIEAGAPVLNLYYEDKHISFDDPRFFAFGHGLAGSESFRAGDAMRWGDGYSWDDVAPLLEDLFAAGILVPAETAAGRTASRHSGAAALPPAASGRACTWAEIGDITTRLAGRAVDPAHLELVVPMFRIAHIVLDGDGRQVGEANVFPRALRLDVPTEWKTCPYPGTRHRAERPMNATALKAMRLHWQQMLAALARIRAAYLKRYPGAAVAPTIADVERLSALVLAVPTYQLVRRDAPLANGELHPALSSLFRVTDGLRMATHQMMFVPVGEAPLSPSAPASVDAILDYVERNYSFHSETGVCAGPANMVREFLDVLVDGRAVAPFDFDPEVEAALADMPDAFDYGLRAMQAHCALFTFYPAMAAAYDALDVALRAANAPEAVVAAFGIRAEIVRNRTLLARDRWRSDRVRTYEELFDGCAAGLAAPSPALADLLKPRLPTGAGADIATELVAAAHVDAATAEAIAPIIAGFAASAHAILAAASRMQGEVNALLGRVPAAAAFSTDDLDVHGHLLGDVPQRMPMLGTELAASLGISLRIDADGYSVSPASAGPQDRRPPADKRPVRGDQPRRLS